MLGRVEIVRVGWLCRRRLLLCLLRLERGRGRWERKAGEEDEVMGMVYMVVDALRRVMKEEFRAMVGSWGVL